MLYDGYTQRINIQAVAEFIIGGHVLNKIETGSPQEREKQHATFIESELRRLLRRSCIQWDDMSDNEKQKLYERETEHLNQAISKMNRLYMEIGAMVGIRLLSQYQETDRSFPELPPEPPFNIKDWGMKDDE